MGKSAKVAISLPGRILEAIEKERKASGESRSEFFRRAVERLLKEEQEAREIEKYVQGYKNIPETDEEVKAIHRIGVTVLAEESW
ncbi:MAG: ribbon-helix-helix protein, CopG family [Dehalococcoidales bacterium]|jgi:metal-responsive CopG/Arc/MetJ family transcriptional regulator|nr:ribbon-helix-helix protein, CopG family [Dehalococcoidales bacterium]MDD3265289.1 ribbon-helix-helix protein, CopG family [Dehalococcoidales bacterium]MDD4323080.1 ribbon-helix-helix protein, CopG family [Dehalococcoidales bacterium]MDD4794440.1 ribbon-helix-helix protein, CopG family [Dehalococcoidales bacterium]MDD5122861.1 ribbon-helix-helix protein, CopG family [Dehalococcoidales bacterium]